MISQFLTADTAEQAVGMKEIGGLFLAGGTEINRLGAENTADTLISVRRIHQLKTVDIHDGSVHIGSGLTFQEALEHAGVPAYLKEALRFMGSRTKRNMATIGGNVAVHRTDSYLLATLTAVSAELVMMDHSAQVYRISLDDYLKDTRCAGDLILRVVVPETVDFAASKRYANTVESHSGLVVSMAVRGGRFRIGLAVRDCGLYDAVSLAGACEADPAITEEALLALVVGTGWITQDSRVYGSAAYRNYLIAVTLRRMLDELLKGGRL